MNVFVPIVLASLAFIAPDEGKKPAAPGDISEAERQELLAHAAADPRALERSSPKEPSVVEDSARKDRIAMFMRLSGVGEAAAHALADAGYGTIGDIIADSADEVSQKSGLSLGIARTVQIAADRHLQAELSANSSDKD